MGKKTYFFMGESSRSESSITPGAPDVYWDGKEEHGLPDDPNTGKPMVFGSKFEKAAYLKAHGLIEAGDKIHGSRPSIIGRDTPQESSPDAAREALKRVREMGVDVRRQEYLRILKENGRR